MNATLAYLLVLLLQLTIIALLQTRVIQVLREKDLLYRALLFQMKFQMIQQGLLL